jgi:hypothetical protein
VPLAERLCGAALVRFSSAWWKRREWPDVLGCAIRFTESPEAETPAPGDQDLLFATIRRPWTMPFAPLATRYRDFLANRYYAVSPFQAPGIGRVEWRLTPAAAARAGSSRAERLQHAVRASSAELQLEFAPYRAPWNAFDEALFEPLVRVRLVEALELDQARLRFRPFRSGRGIRPMGFIHWLRPLAYAASQSARPASGGATASTAQRGTAFKDGSRAAPSRLPDG